MKYVYILHFQYTVNSKNKSETSEAFNRYFTSRKKAKKHIKEWWEDYFKNLSLAVELDKTSNTYYHVHVKNLANNEEIRGYTNRVIGNYYPAGVSKHKVNPEV